jgi:hypothetical protein
MPGINNILDGLFIPVITKLVCEYYYENSKDNGNSNGDLFENYCRIISEINDTRVFCRIYKLQFSKKFMLIVKDMQFGLSQKYQSSFDESEHISIYFDEKKENEYGSDDYACWSAKESFMICNSYIKANKMINSPFQYRIMFWCDNCTDQENDNQNGIQTYNDKIDGDHIAEFCLKHR